MTAAEVEDMLVSFRNGWVANPSAKAERYRGRLEARLRRHFRPTLAQVDEAVVRLKGSGHGRRALADLAALIDNGGSGLDSQNWAALETLVRAAASGTRSFLDDARDGGAE